MSKQAKPTIFSTFFNWLSSADFIRLDDGCMLEDWCIDLRAEGADPVLVISWEDGGNDYEERFTRSAIEEARFEDGKYVVVNDEGERSTIKAGKVVGHYPAEPSGDSSGEFTVTWRIEVNAESPMAAAEAAFEIMRDKSSEATFFNVEDINGERFDVDLFEETIKSMAKQPLNRVGVVIEGGIVQAVVATRPEELDVMVIDYDTEGSQGDELREVEQHDGDSTLAVVSYRGRAEEAGINLNRLFEMGE